MGIPRKTLDEMGDTFTVFPARDKAESLAKRLRADDPEWHYFVRPYAARGFVVVVQDEDGVELGSL